MVLSEKEIRKVCYEVVVSEFEKNVLTEGHLCILGSWESGLS